MSSSTDAFDGKNFHVANKRCNECLFSDAKIVDNKRRDSILKECRRKDTYFLCHKGTMAGKSIVCRGFFETRSNAACRMAEVIGVVKFVEPPKT